MLLGVLGVGLLLALTLVVTQGGAQAVEQSLRVKVVQSSFTFTGHYLGSVTAYCPSGTVAVGGGGNVNPVNYPDPMPPALYGSYPMGSPQPNQWITKGGYLNGASYPAPAFQVTSWAICQ
jgi:hypothetical protein